MCGVAGFFGGTSGRDPAAVLRSMQDALRHRGPDGTGVWVDPRGSAGLAHVRLSIIDPSPAGAQPMQTPDGRHVISFNGEIYNFRALRDELAADGIAFHTHSDTEVLLALLAHRGAEGLSRLRGMFALALWDSHAQRGLLVRDGFGIKPLYYARTPQGIVFASELRALLASGCVPLCLDASAVAGYFATGSVPEPDALVEGVQLLAPGDCLAWGAEGTRTTAFWKIRFPEPSVTDAHEAIALTRSALEDSIHAHFVSDVPVGLFLSGGIDSTALLALARSTGHAKGLAGFSIAVDDAGFNEADVAAATARQFGIDHHVLRLDAAVARSSLAGFLGDMDVPSIDGFNTWTVSGLARQHGFKVVLSGLGGDEMFGGYPSFQQVPRLHAIARTLSGLPLPMARIGALAARLATTSRWRRAAGLLAPGVQLADAHRAYRGIFPGPDAVRLAAHFTGESERAVLKALPGGDPGMPRSEADRISYLELSRYMRNQLLRDSDLMSMAHGLELRLPFVDQKLFDTIATIPAALRLQPGKRLLLDAVPEIPGIVQGAPKRGFAFPIRSWLEQELGSEFEVAKRGLPVNAREWYQQWSVLTFSAWWDARLRAQPVGPATHAAG